MARNDSYYETSFYQMDSRQESEKGGWNGEPGNAQSRYEQGREKRQPYLDRARRLALLTIPALHRQEGTEGSSDEIVPWQSMGAFGINNLSAKEVLALFPPGISHILLEPAKSVEDDISALPPDQGEALRQALQQGLSKVEREFVTCTEVDGDRAVLFDVLRHLNVAGNHALKVSRKTAMLTSIALEQYVTWRDKEGTLIEAVIEDVLDWETVDPDVKSVCMGAGYRLSNNVPCQEPVKVYTWIRLEEGSYQISQEVCGQEVPDSHDTRKPEDLNYLFLRMIAQKGEHYGRSYAEDYEGDLQTLDGLWQTITEAAAIIAKMIRLVKPGGVTSKKAIAEAANGAVITGDVADVATLQSEKQADMSIAANRADKVEGRLERAFLLYSPRTGERVTATEIQQTIKELETGLGGVYSNLEVNLQRPYSSIKLAILRDTGRITKLPKGSVNTVILTGAAALGRYAQGQALAGWLGSLPQWLLEKLAPYINAKAFLDRMALAFSVNEEGLVLTDDQVNANMQAQQGAQMAQQVAPEMVRQGGQMLQKQIPDASATDAQAA